MKIAKQIVYKGFQGAFRICLLLLLIHLTGQVNAQSNLRNGRSRYDQSLLADTNMLSTGDYLEGLERVYQTLNKIPTVTSSFTRIPEINNRLKSDDSTINLLKQRLSLNVSTFNLQNLQMFRTLLDEMTDNETIYNEVILSYDKSLDDMKKEIAALRKDTIIRQIFTTKALRDSFSTQLKALRIKRIGSDSLIKSTTATLNELKAHVAENALSVQELLYQTNVQLKSIGPKAFLKEKRYLWEKRSSATDLKYPEFNQMLDSEQQINQYYFNNTRSNRVLLLFFGVLFFIWIFYNFRSLKNKGKMNVLDDLDLKLISPVPILASFVLIFTMAPVFDLHAPALYIELTQFLLLAVLTGLFFKRIPRETLILWAVFILLFVALSLVRLIGISPHTQRWLILFINLISTVFAVFTLKKLKPVVGKYRILLIAGTLYMLFNGLAILANLFGRTTLMQIFYTTGVYALLHTVSLIVLLQLIIEAFLLQIKGSRMRKNYPDHFEWETIAKDFSRIISYVAVFIWIILLTAHLDVYDLLSNAVESFLTTARKIGSFTFTFGGILLFLGIIWIANFLQKYIAYFFGETGDDTIENVNAEHSRLVVTRLVLLIAGFLLAVAASGLPIDKITVVLGALGVGIGLGLQSIVSNFVSGIILIFDRTIRIGDVVELGNRKGKVKEIGIRSSTLLSDDGAEIIIPNGDILSNNIINWTLSNNNIRVSLTVTIAKPFDKEELISMIKEIILANDHVFKRKAPSVIISPVNGKWSTAKIFFWCNLNNTDTPKSAISDAIFEKLAERNIDTL
ncbi:MAG TPA: mechanosensitive ion channel domain-containing protein [Pseudosphingobacterium sp.]|nr:mechanosensitive ion channel domain-containing protein [Pseudosphingobacterium sp.]